MSGIYIHIPFCRQKCYYCDFYKTVNTSLTARFLTALMKEIAQRKDYLKNDQVQTIYFTKKLATGSYFIAIRNSATGTVLKTQQVFVRNY